MRVIPVIDLLGGFVVRARAGERAAYRPIETPLAADARPRSVAAGLLALGRFDTLYVADLEGIMHGRPDDRTVDALADAFPQVTLWVDNGLAEAEAARAWTAARHARLVVGSETQRSAGTLAALGPAAVLSLDFRGDRFDGPAALLADPDPWPDDVIAMTLARVGSGAGPDLARLAAVGALAGPRRRVYAAGGVRGPADLAVLAEVGVAGALVATALHDGSLDRAALERFAT